ncbi:MAG: YceI family protein [Melioribacteraceae bacterium]|nr:YceI family protein [Melioribacteraceae bacterium]MDD3558664.1 YceI family protein [Melioribacteraceae bacterium]
MKKLNIFLLGLLFTVSSITAQTTWSVDKSHSKIEFTVSHLVISSVTGVFKNYDLSIESDGTNFEGAKVEFSADVNSIFTDNEKRDDHLKSADFFDAANHPKMIFKSKSFTKVDDNEYKLVGDLTIRGITKEVTLDVDFKGTVEAFGGTRAGFVAETEINRFDYGLKWNNLIETGGAVVGKDVEIKIVLELIQN